MHKQKWNSRLMRHYKIYIGYGVVNRIKSKWKCISKWNSTQDDNVKSTVKSARMHAANDEIFVLAKSKNGKLYLNTH